MVKDVCKAVNVIAVHLLGTVIPYYIYAWARVRHAAPAAVEGGLAPQSARSVSLAS